ncbi:hypothetical protein PFICI_07156 [Pestalotiopsis fici W106-1]|uniref:DUF6594 domain-containing protein n=1 Tax=Pestalotiopsis fici (strain W106-1 / CGMCC3.15140) TaxID=1229662 RepID=W3X7Z1_PESFW|nr:uncharacterized protein PFICI_07156 [Pestalotiopsis fici W106-1]ETS82154.1 hypothetical protein PFICI_07156 [Pestalotiopsis fici W106-1]
MASCDSRQSTLATEQEIELRHSLDTEPTDLEVQRKPWKYVGYRRYANFLASDDDLFVLRRFKDLNIRVALLMQDKLTELEEELNELDEAYSQRSAVDIHNGTFRNDAEDREELLEKISQGIFRYNQVLLQQSALQKYPQASNRDVKNIRNWHENHGFEAIARCEQNYLSLDNDLVSVSHKTKTPLRRVIDGSFRLRTLSFWKDKKREPSLPLYDDKYISYYSDKRIDGFVSGFIVCVGLLMLIAPIWILQSLQTLPMKLAVITIFIVAFLLIMSFAMVAKPFEALGATAA